jgi:transposase-like protein
MAEKRRSREQWRELVRGWPGSGLTQAQYCEHHGISTGSLSRWRAVFGREHQAGGGPARSRAEEPVRLLPVAFSQALEPPRSDRLLTLVFGGGVRVEVPPGFDGATLARLVDVLAQRTAA